MCQIIIFLGNLLYDLQISITKHFSMHPIESLFRLSFNGFLWKLCSKYFKFNQNMQGKSK